MKKNLIITALLSLSLLLTGCGSKNDVAKESETANATKEEKIVLNIGVPKAPPTLPILRMIETKAMGDNVEINLDYWNSPEQLIAMTQDGEHDIFALPLTVGAKLFNKGVGVKLTNVNTWGVTYFVTSDPEVKEWKDLKGETIYVPLKSSPPDIVTQYFLNANGLKAHEDVRIQYVASAEIAQMLKGGMIEHAVAIEPQVTAALMGNKDLKVLYSYDEEWKNIVDKNTNIPNAGMGATTEFINNDPDLMKKFEEEYEKALNWIVENPAGISELAENELGLKKQVIEKAIPKAGIMYKNTKDSKAALDLFYDMLFKFNPSTIGGSVPSEDFYYTEE